MTSAGARLTVHGVLAAVAVVAAGCGQAPLARALGHPVLITEAPAGNSERLPAAQARYPAGSRVLLVDATDPAAPPAVLSSALVAAGGAVASHDGARVLFVGKQRADEAYAVWTCGIDGSELRKAAEGPGDCQAADFLPDGRIVFSAALGRVVAGPHPGHELFVAAEAHAPERITFGGGNALDPAVLRDGRIVYAAWQPGESPADGGFALFTVHPDGTGVAPLHGHHTPHGRALPRQGPGGDVASLARPSEGAARVEVLDWRAPAAAARTLEVGGEPLAAAPSAGGGWLVATGAGDLRLVGTDAAATAVFRAAQGREIVHVSDASPRPRPQGQLSSVKPGTPYGTLLGIDARPAGAPGATTVRLRTATAVLGSVPLAADGSFHVRVPPDTPLTLEVLDADGARLSGTRTPFWVRPREVRGCVGCHEPPDVAPGNRAPLAGLSAPVPLHETDSGAGR